MEGSVRKLFIMPDSGNGSYITRYFTGTEPAEAVESPIYNGKQVKDLRWVDSNNDFNQALKDTADAEDLVGIDSTALNIFTQKRKELLLESDYTQLSDAPVTDLEKTDWATYRQELRDMPAQEGFDPANLSWPIPPSPS